MGNTLELFYGDIQITMKVHEMSDYERNPDVVSLTAFINGEMVKVENYKGLHLVPRSKEFYPTCAFKAYRALITKMNKTASNKPSISLIHITFKQPKDKFRVACFFYNELVKTFDSIYDAAMQLRLCYTNIKRVCEIRNKQRKTCGGYVWRYIDGDYRIVEPWLVVDDNDGDDTFFQGIPTRLYDTKYIPESIRKDMLEDEDMSNSIHEMNTKERNAYFNNLKQEQDEQDIIDFVENIASNGKRLKCAYKSGTEDFYHGLDYNGVICFRINYKRKIIEFNFINYNSNEGNYLKFSYVKQEFEKRFGKSSDWKLSLKIK